VMVQKWSGWSINFSSIEPEHTFQLDLPSPPLFTTKLGPVLEIVFWSELVDRWIHGVSSYFERPLPVDHIQITVGELNWLSKMRKIHGDAVFTKYIEDKEMADA